MVHRSHRHINTIPDILVVYMYTWLHTHINTLPDTPVVYMYTLLHTHINKLPDVTNTIITCNFL